MSSGPSQHYTFVHRALPSVFFNDPSWCFAVLNGPDAQRFVADLWHRVGERTEPSGRRAADGLKAETFLDGPEAAPIMVALVTLPAPAEAAEAHFAALVAGFADPSAPAIDKLAWSRFFTLEHGIDVQTEAPCTFICEWTREGEHRNLGGGPPAEEGAFVGVLLAGLTGGEDDGG
jgi:hypothetical protein